MRLVWAVAVALMVAAHPVPAEADAVSQPQLYLPWASGPPERLTCGMKAGPTTSDGDGENLSDWRVVCGGFGRIRDVFTVEPRRLGDDADYIAIGDGAARFVGDGWIVELGRDLWGLESLSLARDTSSGWAVGESDRIARYDRGRWSRFDQETGDESVDLLAVSAPNPDDVAWAGGRRGERAAFRSLARTPSEGFEWVDVPVSEELAPVTDLWVFPDAQGNVYDGLAVAGLDTRGQFLRMLDGAWTLESGTEGTPLELAVETPFQAWSLGELTRRGVPSTGFWQRQGGFWLDRPDLTLTGRTAFDMYQAQLSGQGNRLWLVAGLAPDGDRPVLYDFKTHSDTNWQAIPGSSGPDSADTTAELHRAIAPSDRSQEILYAFGEEAWLLDLATNRWRQIHRRRGFTAITGPDVWSLAPGASSYLVALDDRAEEISIPFRAIDLASHGGHQFVVSPGGAVASVGGPMGRGQVIAPSLDGRLNAVAIRGKTLLAAGERHDRRGVVYGRPADIAPNADDPVPWMPVFTLPDRLSFGDGTSVVLQASSFDDLAVDHEGALWLAGSVQIEPASDIDASPGPAQASPLEGVVVRLSPECLGRPDIESGTCAEAAILSVPQSLISVGHDGRVWVAGGHLVASCTQIEPGSKTEADTRTQSRSTSRLGATLNLACAYTPTSPAPSGGTVSTIAAWEFGGVWSTSVFGPDGRERTRVARLIGDRWEERCELDVPIHAAQVISGAEGSTLWLVGDWSTAVTVRDTGDSPGGCSS